MPDPFQISPAGPDDLDPIVDAQLAMALETENLRLDRQVVRLGVGAVLTDSAKGSYWVARSAEGEFLSVLLTVPEWSDWRNGTVLWIHSLYVVPHARRQGVFRALYDHLKQKVTLDPSLRGLRLYVEQQNTRAQAAYESMGMSRDHYYLYEWLKPGI